VKEYARNQICSDPSHRTAALLKLTALTTSTSQRRGSPYTTQSPHTHPPASPQALHTLPLLWYWLYSQWRLGDVHIVPLSLLTNNIPHCAQQALVRTNIHDCAEFWLADLGIATEVLMRGCLVLLSIALTQNRNLTSSQDGFDWEFKKQFRC